MSDLILFAHPFSSYCQKVITALYEHGTAFSWRLLDPVADAGAAAELEILWPLNRMPLLLEGNRPVVESSIIIDHHRAPGAPSSR